MTVEAEITVWLDLDVPIENGEVDDADVKQAAQDVLGHTGAIVGDVVDVTVRDD